MQCDLPCYRSLSTLLEVRQIKSLLSYSTPNIFFSNTGYNKNILMYFFRGKHCFGWKSCSDLNKYDVYTMSDRKCYTDGTLGS